MVKLGVGIGLQAIEAQREKKRRRAAREMAERQQKRLEEVRQHLNQVSVLPMISVASVVGFATFVPGATSGSC